MKNNRLFVRWAALLSVFALVAHAIDVPDHLSEWWGYGTFFVIAAAFQFFYGIALFLQPWRFDEEGRERENADRYGRPYFILGTVLTASVILVLYSLAHHRNALFWCRRNSRTGYTPLSLASPGMPGANVFPYSTDIAYL